MKGPHISNDRQCGDLVLLTREFIDDIAEEVLVLGASLASGILNIVHSAGAAH